MSTISDVSEDLKYLLDQGHDQQNASTILIVAAIRGIGRSLDGTRGNPNLEPVGQISVTLDEIAVTLNRLASSS